MPRQFVCSCPDFSQRCKKNPYAGSLSLTIDRDWTGSGVALNSPGYCKHIYAVIFDLKASGQYEQFLPTSTPKDLPTQSL